MKSAVRLNSFKKIEAKIKAVPEKLYRNLIESKDHATVRLLEEVKSQAQLVIQPHTGKYFDAFQIIDGRVTNLSPQTGRLEFGYTGIDSLGRYYNQAPRPHFRPALEVVRKSYREDIVQQFKKSWREA